MRIDFLSTAAIGLLALGGCASGGGGSSSVADQAATGELGPALLQWSGYFRPTQAASGDALSTGRGYTEASGTVVLTAPSPSQMRAQINVSMPSLATVAERLPWVIAPGSCGSDNLPVTDVGEFPEITVNQGSGRLDQEVPIPFPISGSYHVEILQEGGNGADQSQVIVCADLSLGRRRGT